jgi:hypothetical protein
MLILSHPTEETDMKRIALIAAATISMLFASAPADAGGLDQIIGGIAEAAVGQIVGGGERYDRYQAEPRYERRERRQYQSYNDDGYGDDGYGQEESYGRRDDSYGATFERMIDGLVDMYGRRKVARCARDTDCVVTVVDLVRGNKHRGLDKYFASIRG